MATREELEKLPQYSEILCDNSECIFIGLKPKGCDMAVVVMEKNKLSNAYDFDSVEIPKPKKKAYAYWIRFSPNATLCWHIKELPLDEMSEGYERAPEFDIEAKQ